MAEMKKIRSREEIPQEDRWALEDIYATDEAWEEAMASLAADQEELVSYAGRLSESGNTLFAYLQCVERTDVKAGLLANYAMRKADEDTRQAKYQAMQGRCISSLVALQAATSFEIPEIMGIADEVLDGFYAACPDLERYRRYLSNLRRMKAHTLSAGEEKLLAAAGEMASAPSNIYNTLNNADMKFQDALDAQGNPHPVTNGSFVPLESSQDRVLRKNAYESLYKTYQDYKNTAAGLLNAQHKQLKFFAEARHYESSFEAALDRTEVPTSVYLNMIEAVHQNLDKMHRYVRLRKKMLGVEELRFYDIYAPLLADVDKEIPFAEAKQTVYDALYPLGEEYRNVLKEGFDNRWIDVYQNQGKRSGAYSAGVSVHPYVLLNYAGNLDHQFILAHEMGHALHSYFSNRTQAPLDAGYVTFVAEVASTCNEALLMNYLLKNTTDKKERAYLINYYMDQIKGNVYRQAMFAEFELNIGRMVAEGKTLTADALSAEYCRLNELYYGPDMVVDDSIAVEWARIPHFYFNYYVFQYATGFSAAVALSRKILNEGECAVQDYLTFLSGGGSKPPIELLKDAGVDMTGPEPVNDALALFGELIEEMEALLED